MQKKGDYDKALEYYNRVLVIWQKILGKKHSQVAIPYNNMGVVYTEKGDYDNALRCYNNALEMIGDGENIGTIYLAKALNYALNNKKRQAQLTLEKVASINNYQKANIINQVGATCFTKGKYKEAICCYIVAKELLEKTDTPKTNTLWAIVYQNLAKAYCYSNQKEKSLPLFEQASIFCEAAKDDELTGKVKKNYAECKAR